MFCSYCGATVADSAAFCPRCGKSVTGGAAPLPTAAVVAPAPPVVMAAPGLYYAGFWLRFVAWLIDRVILGLILVVLIVILALATGMGALLQHAPANPTPDYFLTGVTFVFILGLGFGSIAITWIYYAWMESSRYQGTLGKVVLNLMVTDLECQPISFGRASGRFFSRIITNLIPLFIGYIMIAFTAKKQALHDMIASCLVLRRA